MTTFKRNFDFSYDYMRDVSLNIKKYRKRTRVATGMNAIEKIKNEIQKQKISVVLNQQMSIFFEVYNEEKEAKSQNKENVENKNRKC